MEASGKSWAGCRGPGKAHRVWSCWGKSPPRVGLLSPQQPEHAGPALPIPVLPHRLSVSLITPPGVTTTGLATASGSKVLEKSGAEPSAMSNLCPDPVAAARGIWHGASLSFLLSCFRWRRDTGIGIPSTRPTTSGHMHASFPGSQCPFL